MKLAISGPGRCGKDCAAEWLGANTSLRYVAGTSYWARHLVFEQLNNYADADECWRDRHNHRVTWAAIIGEYNRDDPAKLYRDCLREQDILTGVRWRREMQAVNAAGLVDLWIWVERPGIATDPTMEFGAAECDLIVPNAGTLGEYLGRWKRLARSWGVLPLMPEDCAGLEPTDEYARDCSGWRKKP